MNAFKKSLLCLAAITLLIPFSISYAEDIDIYDTSEGTVNNPNILFVLDNSSNWSAANQNWPTDTNPPVACGNDCNKQGYYELKALRTLISNLATAYGDANGDVPINIGLMMFNNSNATRNGGYVRSAVKPMTSANRTALVTILNTIIQNFNTETAASSVQYAAALFDVFKYFGGFTNPANATTNTAPSINPTYPSSGSTTIPVFGIQYWGSLNGDLSKFDSTAYNGNNYVPVSATSCGRNYIIFIGNGFPAKDDVSSSDMSQVLKDLITPSSPNTAISQFTIYNYSTSSSTSLSNCSTVTTSPGNACQSSSTCTSNLASYPATTTSSTTQPTTTNTTSGVTTSITTTIGQSYSCFQPSSGCSGSTKYKIQGCTATTTSTTTGTPGQPSGNAVGRYADEFTNFLYQTDVNSLTGQQNITTYAVDVYKDQQDLNQTALMRNMASYGHGSYYAASDLNQLSVAFNNILAEIQSVNSVFASSSLPVSVNTQGTYLNQVFVGMFKPDSGAKPRWFGNLKQYQFKIFDGVLRLADSTGTQAINSQTGFITPCADSYWTSDSGTYWLYNSSSLDNFCPISVSSKSSDLPDGATVEKGGAAQKIRGTTATGTSTNYSTRALKTCDSSNGCSAGLTNFDTSNSTLTYTALGVSSGTETSLINWIRGQDVDNENNTTAVPNAVTAEVRPSVHGGVVHSQPAVIDYGGTTGVVSFYGADDGVFHAINGNKTGTSAGNELWGFIAPEFYSRLHRLRDNSPIIKFPSFSTSITPTPQSKDYFFDGSTGVFQRTSTSTVWIYPTMRRGGRAIYAFDVSTPTSPTLKWRKGCFTNSTSDDSNCSTGWSSIGQTWSKPQIGYLNGYVDASGNAKPVLVFGGGYDTCEDTNSQTRCTTTPRKGANIWFVDADTGSIIRTYSTNYSVPGDVFLLNDSSGKISYVYAADTGGYIYRINVGTYDGSTLTSWTSNSAASNITIASLSETGQARKFLFGPDVVSYVGYKAVMIGSGDREHPLISDYPCSNYTSSGVTNQFYMIKDTPNAYPSTPIAASDLTDVTTNLTATIGGYGYKFTLVNPSTGSTRCEQVVNKALTIGGVVYFGTNAPKSSSEKSTVCGSDLGNARGYAVDFLTGAPAVGDTRYTDYQSGGLPPSPVGGVVDVDGTKVPFCIGCTSPGDTNPSPLQGTPITINPSGPRKRVYWYIESE